MPADHEVRFPQKPITDDERRSEFLRLMEVPRFPQVYVLGCFARYVTIYAQQIRALNLVDCLAKAGIVSGRSKVAVVGGGISGLTAASAAIVRGVTQVVVFEKDRELLHLQATSQQRYIHPHIYDWPADGALDDDAGLPILNWKADLAKEVVEKMLEDWRILPGREKIEQRVLCGDIAIRSGVDGPIVESAKGCEAFMVVILAAGFGRDSHSETDSYWTDSRIDGREAEEEGEWLVSGAGDGALTDLMRLCISKFSHKRVLEAVDQQARQTVGSDLLNLASAKLSSAELAGRFEKAAAVIAPQLNERLKPRDISKIWLNSTRDELFSPKSSILNRLIVAWLKTEKRFDFLPHPGRIISEPAENGIDIGDEEKAEIPSGVRHMILRHGPHKGTRFSEMFPELYQNCGRMALEWRAAAQYEDWTREALFDNSEFGDDPKKVPPLRVDFGDAAGCVIVGSSRETPGAPLENKLRTVLEGRFGKYARRYGMKFVGQPVRFSSIDALANSAAYERLVRAISHSAIAVFDLTGYEPAVLVLLGIRAAVRRGITLTVTRDPRPAVSLPFNIGGLNPIPLSDKFSEDVYQALTAGFSALKAQPNVYLDLPAYDALRKLGEDHRLLEPDQQILILRWFDPQYSGMVKDLVEERMKAKFEHTTVVTTLDSRSPQLAEQRLYAAIRRTRLCVADWTGWRPNVFFEIGVRLAINPTDPILMRCREKPPGWDDNRAGGVWLEEMPPGAKELERFFRPVLFTLTADDELRDRFDLLETKQPPRPPDALLSPGRTYAVVEQSIDRHKEAGGIAVQQFLVSEAKSLVGDFEPGEGNSIPVLFPDSLGKQASKAAMECLIASWFYLNHRHKLFEKRNSKSLSVEESLLLKELEEVSTSIDSLNKRFPDESVREICKQIADAMSTTE
jgi:hypothetical protein